MKKIFILASLSYLLSGCTTVSIHEHTKKEPTFPYKKILAVYLDQACDFSLFDSTAYNICLRSTFLETSNFPLREHVENMIVQDLATSGTKVLESASLFDSTANSYTYFRRCIDSLGIDVILLAGRGGYYHNQVYDANHSHGFSFNDNEESHTFSTGLDAKFNCYLINPKSIFIPIWIAEVEEKSKRANDRNSLNRKMAKIVAKTLKSNGYIAH